MSLPKSQDFNSLAPVWSPVKRDVLKWQCPVPAAPYWVWDLVMGPKQLFPRCQTRGSVPAAGLAGRGHGSLQGLLWVARREAASPAPCLWWPQHSNEAAGGEGSGSPTHRAASTGCQRLGDAAGIQARSREVLQEDRQAGWRQHVGGPGRASASQRVCVCIRTLGDVAQAEMRLANVLQTQTS